MANLYLVRHCYIAVAHHIHGAPLMSILAIALFLVVKAAQKERKRQKADKKRESRRRKKKVAARRGEESLAEIEARWAAAYKAGKENANV